MAAVLLGAMVWMMWDAARQRAVQRGRAAQAQALVRVLGTADMALSSSSRWLRHPSLTEPGAPFADGPAILDVDPAGAMMRPPWELWAAEGWWSERFREESGGNR